MWGVRPTVSTGVAGRVRAVLLALGLLVLGAVVLYVGAEGAVRGAAGLARATGIPAFVLGALLFGTDLEGLGTAVVASARGQTSVAAGEVFGAVLFVWGVAFGVATFLAKAPIPSPGTAMVLAPALPLLAASVSIVDGAVARWEGVVLLFLFGLYGWFVIREARGEVRHRTEEIEREAGRGPRSRGGQATLAVGGLLILYIGATVLVAGAERLILETGLLTGFVGAAILGAVVSLDEVVLEVLPVRRGSPELATGNLFGTMAAFTSGVLGLAAVVRPLTVDGPGSLALLGAAVLYALVGTAFLARDRVGKVIGVGALLVYGGWLVAAWSV
jgi:cation:H+ antiporter